jgi:hypothetical protein
MCSFSSSDTAGASPEKLQLIGNRFGGITDSTGGLGGSFLLGSE